jgi:hypothetical protein
LNIAPRQANAPLEKQLRSGRRFTEACAAGTTAKNPVHRPLPSEIIKPKSALDMSTRLHLVLLAAIAVLMLVPQNSYAQMRGFGARAGFAPRGEMRGAPWRGQSRRGIYLGDPFWGSDYASDEPYSYADSGRQVILLQPPAEPEPPQPRVQPLMIELQGDRYVRTGGFETADSGVPQVSRSLSSTSSMSLRQVSANAAPVHLPTVLVYRDGHREDVSGYAIIHNVIYARGDYYQDGYWTKNIQLSLLNIPATLKANQDNGVKFILPASPNEVVTRP